MSHLFVPRAPATRRIIQSRLQRYGLAVVLVAIAIGPLTWLGSVMGHPSVAFFMGAILLGAWFGGVGPALLCLVLLHVVHGYWFEDPPGLWQPTMQSIVTTIGWYVVGITAGLLSHRRTSALLRAQAEQCVC